MMCALRVVADRAVASAVTSSMSAAAFSLFTGTSNQLGEFRAGVLAALFGAVPAVLIGGVGTIVVAALWMTLFPELRRIRAFEG